MLFRSEVRSYWTSCVSRQINVPGPGYVLAIGTTRIVMDHNYADTDQSYLGLSGSADTCTTGTLGYLAAYYSDGTDYYDEVMTVNWVFPVDAAGTYTYYLVAKKNGPAATWSTYSALTLVYVPTAYGTIATAAEDIGGDVSEAQRASRSGLSTPATSASMDDVLRELAALRQKVEALENQ